MTKTVRARYTLEFKQEAVRLVEGGQSIAATAGSWTWWSRRCSTGSRRSGRTRSKVADSKVVSAEQPEISQLRAELARVKMERYILGKATVYLAKAKS